MSDVTAPVVPRSRYRLNFAQLAAKRAHPKWWRNLWSDRRWAQYAHGRALCTTLSIKRQRRG